MKNPSPAPSYATQMVPADVVWVTLQLVGISGASLTSSLSSAIVFEAGIKPFSLNHLLDMALTLLVYFD